MALTRSLPTQHASGLTLIDERRIAVGRFARNADGTARVGVLPAHPNPLVTGRASMGYDIGAFNAVTARTSAGAEEIANDGTVTVATPAAPASNSRIDVIWVRAQFTTPVATDANNDVVFGVTQGTAAASPTKPAIPPGAAELATATIPSTATTTLSSGVVITQTFAYTAAAGGTVWMRNAAEMDAWSPSNGAMVLRLDLNAIFKRIGGAWVQDRVTTGGMISAGTNASGVVQVPHGLGKTPIGVSATPSTTTPNGIAPRTKTQIGTVGATTFDVQVLRADQNDAPLANHPVVFHWIAVG